MLDWASHAHYGPLRWTFVLFKGFTTCLIRLESFLHMSVSLFPVDKRNQANNPRKRNSPTCAEEIRVEISFEELVCYVLCVNKVYIFSFFIKVSLHFMHTCIHCNFFRKKKMMKYLKMHLFSSHKPPFCLKHRSKGIWPTDIKDSVK